MDSAFATAPYPGCTTAQLEKAVAEGRGNNVMIAEIERRLRRDAGDVSVMTGGERLRRLRTINKEQTK
jgi:hypothetical protein